MFAQQSKTSAEFRSQKYQRPSSVQRPPTSESTSKTNREFIITQRTITRREEPQQIPEPSIAYLQQLQGNIQELQLLGQLLEEKNKLEYAKLQNQFILQEHQRKIDQIREDKERFDREISKMRQFLQKPPPRFQAAQKLQSNPQQTLNVQENYSPPQKIQAPPALDQEVFEQSRLMSSQLEGHSEQVFLESSFAMRSYYKDLKAMREMEMTQEFPNQSHKFVYPDEGPQFPSLPQVPQVLEFEGFDASQTNEFMEFV